MARITTSLYPYPAPVQVLGPGCCASPADMRRDGTVVLPCAADLDALRHGRTEPGAASGSQPAERAAAAHSPAAGLRASRGRRGAKEGKADVAGAQSVEGQEEGGPGRGSRGHSRGRGGRGGAKKAGGKASRGKKQGKEGEEGEGSSGAQGGDAGAADLPFFKHPGVLHQGAARNPAEENAALEAYFQVCGSAAHAPMLLLSLQLQALAALAHPSAAALCSRLHDLMRGGKASQRMQRAAWCSLDSTAWPGQPCYLAQLLCLMWRGAVSPGVLCEDEDLLGL